LAHPQKSIPFSHFFFGHPLLLPYPTSTHPIKLKQIVNYDYQYLFESLQASNPDFGPLILGRYTSECQEKAF